jgi:hypothetical protein
LSAHGGNCPGDGHTQRCDERKGEQLRHSVPPISD